MDHTPAHESAHKVQNTCTVTGESYRIFSSGILKRLQDVERRAAEGSVQCAASSSMYASAADNIPPSSPASSSQQQHSSNNTMRRLDDRFSVNAMMDALGESTPTTTRTTTATPRKLDVSEIPNISVNDQSHSYYDGGMERSPTVHFGGPGDLDNQEGHRSPNPTPSHINVPGSTAVANWKLSSTPRHNQQQEHSTIYNSNFELSSTSHHQNSLIRNATEYLRTIRTAVPSINDDDSMAALESPPSPDRRQTSIFFDYTENDNNMMSSKLSHGKEDEGAKSTTINQHTNSASLSTSQSPLLPKKKVPEVHPDLLEARQLIAAAKERYHLYSTTTAPPPRIDIMVTSPTPVRGVTPGKLDTGKKLMSRGRKGLVPPAATTSSPVRNPALIQQATTSDGSKEKQLEETAKSSPQTTQVKDLYFSGGQNFLTLKKCAEVSAGMTFSPERRRSSRASSSSFGGSPESDDLDSDIDEMMQEISRIPTTVPSNGHHQKAVSYEEVPFFKGFSVPSTRKGLQQKPLKSINNSSYHGSSSGQDNVDTPESTAHKLDRMRPPKLEGFGTSGGGPMTSSSLPGGAVGGADALKRRAPSRISDNGEKERELLLEIEKQNAEREKQQENEAREIIRQARETAATKIGVEPRLLPSYLDDNGFMFDDPFAGDRIKTLQIPAAQASLPLQVPSTEYPLTMTWPQAASHPDRLLIIDSGVYQQASQATLIHHWKSRRIAIVGKRLYVFRHPSTKKELQCEIDEQVAQEAADRREEAGYHRQVAAASSPHSAASIQHPGPTDLSPNSKLFNRSVFSVGVDCLSGEVPKGNYLGKKCVVVFRYSHPTPPTPNGPEERIKQLIKPADTNAATYYASTLASSAATSAASGGSKGGGLLSSRGSSPGKKKSNPSEVSVVLSFTIPEHLKEMITVVYTATTRAKSLRDCAVQELLSGKRRPLSSSPARNNNNLGGGGGTSSPSASSIVKRESPQDTAVKRARLQAASDLGVAPSMIANYFDDNGVLTSGGGTTSTGNDNIIPDTLLWNTVTSHPEKALVVESGVFLQAFNSNILHHWKSRRIAIVGKRLYVFRHPESDKDRQTEANEMHANGEEKRFSQSVFSVGVERLTGEIAGGNYLGKKFVATFHYTPPSLFEKDPTQLESKLGHPQHQGSPVRLASPKRSQQSPPASSVITLAFKNADDLKNTISLIVLISSTSKKLKARAVECLSQDPNTTKPAEDVTSPTRRRRGVSFASPK